MVSFSYTVVPDNEIVKPPDYRISQEKPLIRSGVNVIIGIGVSVQIKQILI